MENTKATLNRKSQQRPSKEGERIPKSWLAIATSTPSISALFHKQDRCPRRLGAATTGRLPFPQPGDVCLEEGISSFSYQETVCNKPAQIQMTPSPQDMGPH